MNTHRYSATEASALLANGKLTAVRLAEDCLAQVAAREEAVQAWSFIDPQQVLADARARDSEKPRGPLHGIPVAVKDIIDTADMPTTYGSPIYAGYRPRIDAACVALLKQAGAVIMGKTVTAEFAMSHPGPTRNPHNPAHTPGGSSSGSAAAVADFMAPLALGTQTGGSVLRPAAFCGIVGFKPSFDAISPIGVKANTKSFDTVGLMGRSVGDVALALSVMTGSRFELPAVDKPRIGFYRTLHWDKADAATQSALEGAASQLAKAGARVSEVTLPARFEELLRARNAVGAFESSRALAWERANHEEQIAVREKLRKSDAVTFDEYVAAQKVLDECRRLLGIAFNDYDALLVPSAPGEAPKGLQSTGDSVFNQLWTALHVPCVTVPVFKGPNGLPIGAQLVGPYGGDYRTLGCAGWAQRALM
ncbi:MAG TPA: amidase [Burkholderiales bacterium]|nr:amidase [Burkholderiales bacterium]